MSFGIIAEIKTILESIKVLYEYTNWNTSSEIEKYPACVADIILQEFTKQVSVGQFYDVNLRLGFYFIYEEDIEDEIFERKIDEALNRIFSITGYNDISLQNTTIGHFEISGHKTKSFFAEIQFNKKGYME